MRAVDDVSLHVLPTLGRPALGDAAATSSRSSSTPAERSVRDRTRRPALPAGTPGARTRRARRRRLWLGSALDRGGAARLRACAGRRHRGPVDRSHDRERAREPGHGRGASRPRRRRAAERIGGGREHLARSQSRPCRRGSTRRRSSPRATSRPPGRRSGASSTSSGGRSTAGPPTCTAAPQSPRIPPWRRSASTSSAARSRTQTPTRSGGPRAQRPCRERRRRRRRDQHLLRDERSSREEPQGCGARARAHARVYVTGCAANLQGEAFANLPSNVTVVAKRSEETASFIAGDVGRSAASSRPTRASTACAPS